MKRKVIQKYQLLAFLLATTLIQGAFSEGTELPGKRYAILVGINDYADRAILKLSTPRNDAADLGRTLNDAGWDRVFVLKDDMDFRDQDFPNRTNIENRVELLADLVEPEDTIFFFFSGHGMSDGNFSWLLPVDASLNRLTDTSISLASVISSFTARGIHRIVVAIDACREQVSLTKGLTVVGISDAAWTDTAALSLYATKSGWYSYEDERGKNSLFTRFLLQGLSGDADGSTSEADGVVTFSELAAWLPDATASYALDRGLRQKAVALEGSLGTEVLAIPVAGTLKPRPKVSNETEPDTQEALKENTHESSSQNYDNRGGLSFSFLQLGFSSSLQLFPQWFTIGGAAVGIISTSNTAVYGVQCALFPKAEKMGGIQAGVISKAQTVWGVQNSCIVNTVDTVYGGQVGLINNATEVYGAQIGLINHARKVRGVQIGLINTMSEYGLFGRFMFGLNIGF